MNLREITLLMMAFAASANVLGAQDGNRARASAAPPGLHLVITKNVTDELGALADSLAVETVRCLIGITRGESAVVDLVWNPKVASRTPGEGHVHRCPLATVAIWRNRPVGPHQRPERACYLSGSDIQEAKRPHSPPIQIVQVTSLVACWWTHAQIELGVDTTVLESLPGQRRGDPVDARPAVCRGARVRGNACALRKAGGWEGGRAVTE